MKKTNKEQKEILSYTMVLHQARTELGITLLQYCVADSIYHLSNNPENKIAGWCYASKETIGDWLSISAQSVWDTLKPLIEKKLIEKNPDNRQFLRTTKKWYKAVILRKLEARGQSRKILDSQGLSDRHQGKPLIQSRKTLDNIYSINKDKDNNKKFSFNNLEEYRGPKFRDVNEIMKEKLRE